ncbi:hypothetical protein [Catenuloplanes japonicus]|uniref:hypothetical protein n=1 Tax=Catenuloplanes japonicus TaxID=33876 RepID=UPI000526C7EE|nr:hypothetical protein [Catenuloplanes japonicus]
MDENTLRDALRSTMTLDAPPPMESSTALAAGRRAVRQRFAVATAGTAAALAVTVGWGLGPGTALFQGSTQAAGPGTDPLAPVAAAPSRQPQPGIPAGEPAPGNGSPAPTGTEPVWPLDGDGKPQTDATSRSGHRFEQGVKVRDELLAVIPDGFTAGEQYHQATAEGQGKEAGSTWQYSTSIPITKDGRTGRIEAEVHTPGNGLPDDLCTLAIARFGGVAETCQVTTVDGKQVAVVTPTGTETFAQEARADQWAAYRHPDGTVVIIAQDRTATQAGGSGATPLTTLPLTAEALATLATDARFHLS